MSDVYRRGSIYWCWVKDHNGKWGRKSTGRRDKLAARLEKRRLERLYADPNYFASHETKIKDAVDRFIEERGRRGKAAGTIKMYEQKSGHINRLFGGESALATITASRVDWYIGKRESEGASKHTIHKELVTLRGILKIAKRRNEFPHDISGVMPVGYSAEYEPRTAFLTREQLEKLLGELGPHRAAQVAYAVATGARRGELFRARRSDVEGGFAALRGTKTKKSARTIPIVDLFSDLLERALRDAPGSDPLFQSWGNARRDIIRACDRAGVPHVTWNDLRRTFSTLLRQQGAGLDDLADLLGHEGTAMVRRVYGQDTPERLRESLRKSLTHSTVTAQSKSTPKRKPRKK